MPFQTVILWTDALVFLLLVAVGGMVVYVRRHEHLRQSWWRVARSPAGMVGAVLLAFFVVVGLLDSLHFRVRLDSSATRAQATYNEAHIGTQRWRLKNLVGADRIKRRHAIAQEYGYL